MEIGTCKQNNITIYIIADANMAKGLCNGGLKKLNSVKKSRAKIGQVIAMKI